MSLNNILIVEETQKNLLKTNTQTLFKILLKTQNNIEIFEKDFYHFWIFCKNKIHSYK